MPELVVPTTTLHASFLSAVDEFALEDRATTGGEWLPPAELARRRDAVRSPEGFAAFVEDQLRDADPDRPRAPGRVPQTTWWWVEDETYLGRISARHLLNDFLREAGGHVGYDIRPSARRRGHATAMLAAALPHVAGLGIDPALITCDVDNHASARVIEANGGVLEDVRQVGTYPAKRR